MPVWLRHGGFWLAVAVLAVVAPALWLTREGEGPLRWPVAFVREAVAPAQRGAAALVGGVRGTVEAVAELGRLREENAALRREADRLPALESALEELRQENERLRELLQFRDELRGIYPYEGVAARVIGRSPDAWYGTVTIDKGSAAGVREGMVVVEAQGLVGRVVSTSPHTAVVRLLTDPQSGVGAQVQRAESGAYGVVLGQGSGRQLNMRFYSRDADVVPGDVVVTSGLSALFPAGLPIGRVTAVDSEDFGLVRTARVEPFADIDRLREVLLLPFPPPVGAAPGGERA